MTAKRAARALVALLVLGAAGPAGADSATPLLIVLPPDTLPADVGAGGFVTVGSFFEGGGLLWMPIGGVTPIGGTAGVAVSRDGKVIAGNARDPRGDENAALWQGGQEWRVLGSIVPGAASCDRLLSSAYGTNDDGRVVVGLAWNGCQIARAFRWEESTGMVDLGSTVADRSSRANGVSGNGQVVVGWQEGITGFRIGARWVGGVQSLFRGPDGDVGEARAANSDGSLIVGSNCLAAMPSAWVWTPQTGVRCYPYERAIMNNPYQTLMLATSEDGRVIGGATSFGLESEALLWLDGKPQLLRTYLRANGQPDAFRGWVNTGFIQSVSPDGRTLVGYGAGPAAFQGYMVVLPALGPPPPITELSR